MEPRIKSRYCYNRKNLGRKKIKILNFITPPNNDKSGNFISRQKFVLSSMKGIEGNQVLDVGQPNRFGKELGEIYGVDIVNTRGDLDTAFVINSVTENFMVVWIFEVIEHLKNPDLFLRKIKTVCAPNARIFVTYPYHRLRKYWNNNHFHEMDLNRFVTLINGAGYKIVDYKHMVVRSSLCNCFKGFRPIVRYLFGACHNYYFELRRIN